MNSRCNPKILAAIVVGLLLGEGPALGQTPAATTQLV